MIVEKNNVKNVADFASPRSDISIIAILNVKESIFYVLQ
jgi:hypothetical protein